MGHGHEPFEVPHWTKYNSWSDAIPLQKHVRKLERLGLHDPWIRNVAFLYIGKKPMADKSLLRTTWNVFKPGLPYGIAAAVAMIVFDEWYIYRKHGCLSWSLH